MHQLEFKMQRQMQPDFMYAAVASNEIDVIAGYTSDGLIAKYDLVTLDDPKHIIPPYDAILAGGAAPAGDDKMQAGIAAASATSPSMRCATQIYAQAAEIHRMKPRAGFSDKITARCGARGALDITRVNQLAVKFGERRRLASNRIDQPRSS